MSYFFISLFFLNICFASPLFAESLRLDRPQPWLEYLPDQFKQNFHVGIYSRKIMTHSPFEIDIDPHSKDNETNIPKPALPEGVFYSTNQFNAYALDKSQIRWAVTMDPHECQNEFRCLAILSEPQTHQGQKTQPLTYIRTNKLHPETNQVVHCKMVNSTQKNDTITLSECFQYSKSNCAAWNTHLKENKTTYEQLKYKTNPHPDYTSTQEAIVNFRKSLARILRAPDSKNMKRSLNNLTQENRQLRWEPIIKVVPVSTGSSLADFKDLFTHEQICNKYKTFFMTDSERDIWNRSQAGQNSQNNAVTTTH